MTSRADNELNKQMKMLYEDYYDLMHQSNSFKDDFTPAPFDSPQEDYNGGLGFGVIIADIKIHRAKKRTPNDIIKAIRDNDMIKLFRAVHFGTPDLQYRDSSGYSAMDWAVEYNRPVAIKVLLDAGVKADDYDPSVGMPLLNALSPNKTFYGEHMCAQLLMQGEADVYKKDDTGENAIMKIIKFNMVNLFEELNPYELKKCPLTNDGENVLHYAARYGENDIIQRLLDMDINIMCKTARQKTILHILSARANKEEFIEYVIDKGVDVNEVDVLGNTALHYASEKGQFGNVQILLRAGASPLMRNLKQEMPMDKMNNTAHSDPEAIVKVSALLSKAMRATYQKMLEQSQFKNTSQPIDQLQSENPSIKITTSKIPSQALTDISEQHIRE